MAKALSVNSELARLPTRLRQKCRLTSEGYVTNRRTYHRQTNEPQSEIQDSVGAELVERLIQYMLA